MSAVSAQFSSLYKQLDTGLHSLSSEAKRRNSEVKHASEKSLKILKTVHDSGDFLRHPDFVVPFVLACSSRSAKLTTIGLQGLQNLSSTNCIPKDRLIEVLDGFIDATHLAMEIQLKVLQVVPIFFKTYARYIHGQVCMKLLQCCSVLLQLPQKSSIVASTASATLQQLVDEIFERLSYNWDDNSKNTEELQEIYDVLINNNDTIKVNTYRYDANRLFSDLFTSMETKSTSNEIQTKEMFITVKEIPIDYGLEILESILNNNKQLFLQYEDLQFLLRTKGIPLLLRCISGPKNFSTSVRSCRCIKLLFRKEYLPILELELEVIFSLLIHGFSTSSNLPPWQKVLSLELYNDMSRDFEMINAIYTTYDIYSDKKHILSNILEECKKLLDSDDFGNLLAHSNMIEKIDMPLILHESSVPKTKFIHLLDKSHAPTINHTYIIWLILSISNHWSEGLSTLVLSSQNKDTANATEIYNGLFQHLFEIHKLFLYSSAFDTNIFHALVRAFQKLAHGAGILGLNEELNQCLSLFSYSIVNNVDILRNNSEDKEEIQEKTTSSTAGVLNAISETLIGSTPPTKQISDANERKSLHPRQLNSKHISLFRALISLAIAQGSSFDSANWRNTFVTWQWVSYFIYGPSVDFMETFYNQDVPPAPKISKNDVTNIENNILKLFETTTSYSQPAFKCLVSTLIKSSNNTIFVEDETTAYSPVSQEGEVFNCIYNKGFYVTQVGEITAYNHGRFFSTEKGDPSWQLLVDHFVSLIGSREISSSSLRLYITRVFTDVIKSASSEVANIEDPSLRTATFDGAEELMANALLSVVDSLKRLEIGKNEIYQGTLNIESDILLQILSTLKGILNEVGDLLKSSWFTIFSIINSPFELLNNDVIFAQLEDTDDSSLVNGIFQKHLGMIQVAYDVFKLIFDDLLQTIPLNVIKSVIDTLVNFINQTRDLNISFSSISQFWLIGDYLGSRYKDLNDELDNPSISLINETTKDEKLIDFISSKNSSPKILYNGLWLYLLRNLVECSKDSRIEVRNGTIQTFFRIIDSQTNSLPPWDALFVNVLKSLLDEDLTTDDLTAYVDFYDVAIKGLVNLYPLHFRYFGAGTICIEAWLDLFKFLGRLFLSAATGVKYVAISNYQQLLQSMVLLENIPDVVLDKSRDLWSSYTIIYGDTTDPSGHTGKSEYDCVLELIRSFPYLYDLMDKYKKITYDFMGQVLNSFNSAARYPLLPEHSNDQTRPAALQQAILDAIDAINVKESIEITLLIIVQLSAFSVLTLDTREKIEAKLAPKLSNSSRSRIPTFEAISYLSCQKLNKRIEVLEDNAIQMCKEKQMMKILRNLADIIQRKLFINLKNNSNDPIWVVASKSFRDIFMAIFVNNTSHAISKSSQIIFCGAFVSVVVSLIEKTDNPNAISTEVHDISEYVEFRKIFLDSKIIGMFNEEQLKAISSSIWTGSFIFELDEFEKALLSGSENLQDVLESLSVYDFEEYFGSIVEEPLLTKKYLSKICMEDLSKLITISGDSFIRLMQAAAPYFLVRIGLVLRRYISNENLQGRAPLSTLRKIEINVLLDGFSQVMEYALSDTDAKEALFGSLVLLYPLILKTIPVSHKIEGLQDKVLKISLAYTKLMSQSS
ncbi:hypothetical protein KAFR_0A08350 [Kazachstania africana CBS 2517]|uniref:Uncharacterized protein n=1 Tax=Kazachstania africana (strain ATCC 22294 / BCRC 22015 / CBS 2517 / CECT 1963 / NBRC 1671 / NRRL Y-8276) TaxID=1071382 RepID=H2APG9_KAZAF|nr:hypothetical protein KAFR_0A08350 [Kazachstania africana CBS 2517]CCF56269.1 hypothetical protein KAFR_0A08350 [Kazachstania africana CBS 2517]